MQGECVAFTCKQYIFMQDKAPCHWSKYTLHYIAKRGVSMFDWLGYSLDLNSILDIWNIMKDKSGKLPKNNKETALEKYS